MSTCVLRENEEGREKNTVRLVYPRFDVTISLYIFYHLKNNNNYNTIFFFERPADPDGARTARRGNVRLISAVNRQRTTKPSGQK